MIDVSHPWDGYLTGPENELAMAAAQAMARGVRDGISPLVVYGPSGVGKSRLLAGLAAERVHRQPGSSVAHLSAEAFVAACLEASGIAGGGGWSALRGRFRSVDLLIIEDLEGLERGPFAHDELVYTLDALDAAVAAVAFSARSAPGTWSGHIWSRRLVNRLSAGLMTQVAPPGLVSRRRYVLQHASSHGLALQAEAAEMLAQAADGYRTLDGWITRLALEARLQCAQKRGKVGKGGSHARVHSPLDAHSLPAPLDADTVATILADETLLATPVVTIDMIARRVSERFNIRLSVLRGPSRRAAVITARHVAIHLARTVTGSSFAAIGSYFGSRDSATVRHACKIASERASADPALAAVIASLEVCRPRTPT